jgi:hypothetical protein
MEVPADDAERVFGVELHFPGCHVLSLPICCKNIHWGARMTYPSKVHVEGYVRVYAVRVCASGDV